MEWKPQPVDARRTFQDAVDQIEFAITVGDLTVGTRLPSERAMATAMGVSRPTVREALKVLSEVGALHIEAGAGGGAFVTSDTVSRTHLRAQVQLTVGDIANVLEARRLIEPNVAQLAGIFGTESDFRQMQETIDKHRLATHDRDLANRLDDRFHIGMARATGNPVLLDLIRQILHRLSLAADMDYRLAGDPDRAVCAHEETLAAIMSRDPAQIAAAMDRHLAILEQMWATEAGQPRLHRLTGDQRQGPS
jgi:GntR family transcriptional repressor for pyruvate dehydrogenase complex